MDSKWNPVDNACLIHYVLYKITNITMIQTKTEEMRDNEIREQLEFLTYQMNQLQKEIDETNPVDDNAKLKKLCAEMDRHQAERNRLINLLNIVR